jgi:RNA exonuclease 4
VINNAGNVLLDKHVAQKERVTDYRTRFSGIRPSDLVGAPSLEEVQAEVAAMFKGRVIVGHAITNDLTVRCGLHTCIRKYSETWTMLCMGWRPCL